MTRNNFQDTADLISTRFDQTGKALEKFLRDGENLAAVDRLAKKIHAVLQAGGRVFSCGNGGSMCDAMHFAEELTGRFRSDRKPYSAIAISDPSHISCVGNDYGFEFIFSRYIEGVGRPGDMLICLSTSGNSKNILNAIEAARKTGIHAFALLGKDGGKAAVKADDRIVVHDDFSDRIQEVHIKILHIAIDATEYLFKVGEYTK